MSSIIDDNTKSENNTGFGTNANSYGGRFVNKDGTANVEKRGLNFFKRISWHHTLIDLPLYKFLGILLVFYILINFFLVLLFLLPLVQLL